jgi:predicted translin family RNA/ssDNA-binding protein
MMEDIFKKIAVDFERKERIRDNARLISKEISKISREKIDELHKEKEVVFSDLKNRIFEIKKLLERDMDIFYEGWVEDSMKDFAEACILKSILNNERVPDYGELDVTERAYVFGMCRSIRELRRAFLESLEKEEIDEAKRIFSAMEGIYITVGRLDCDYADLKNERKKVVYLIERSKENIALLGYGKRKEEKKTEEEGLDLDSVWR